MILERCYRSVWIDGAIEYELSGFVQGAQESRISQKSRIATACCHGILAMSYVYSKFQLELNEVLPMKAPTNKGNSLASEIPAAGKAGRRPVRESELHNSGHMTTGP